MSTAIRAAFEGRRGPTHLTVPVDVQSATVEEEEVRYFRAESYRRTRPIVASQEAIEEAVRLLRGAERPIIIASTPSAYGDWGAVYERLIETTKIPLLTEEAARGIVPDDHPYCFGFFDLSQHTAANLVREADVVLFLGKLLDFTIGFGFGPVIPNDATVIQVEPEATQAGRNRGTDLALIGDVGPIAAQLADEAEKGDWPERPWVERFRTAVAEHKVYLEQYVTDEVPLRSMFVHHTLAQRLRRDDVLVFDGGDYAYYGRAYLPALAAALVVLPAEPRHVGAGGTDVDSRETRETGIARVLHHGRRRVRVQRDGGRHRRAPRAEGRLPRGERRGVGHRQEPAGGVVRQGRDNRPRAIALRPRRSGAGRVRGTRRAPGGPGPRA